MPEMIAIGVLAVVVFGPERLPELARNAARLLGRIRTETSKAMGELRRAADFEDLEQELRSLRAELAEVRDDVTGAARGTKPVSRGGPGTHAVDQGDEDDESDADDRVGAPPIDLEAT